MAIDRGAVFSTCRKYRYRLWRDWDQADDRTALFVMLNPSTADEDTDDQTIRKCVGFAKHYSCSRIEVVNVFPLIATDPGELKSADVFGPGGPSRNLAFIGNVLEHRSVLLALAAWGNLAAEAPQLAPIRALLTKRLPVMALGLTKDGNPRHPVRLAYDTPLVKLWPKVLGD